jgi:hypothetical protein
MEVVIFFAGALTWEFVRRYILPAFWWPWDKDAPRRGKKGK